MTDTIPRRVSEMIDIQRRWAEAEHEWTCADDPDPHPVEAHEPFDVTVGEESWDDFMARLARHGLRLSLADDTVIPPTDQASVLREWSKAAMAVRMCLAIHPDPYPGVACADKVGHEGAHTYARSSDVKPDQIDVLRRLVEVVETWGEGNDADEIALLDEARHALAAWPAPTSPREHVTDATDPLACWCGPYRDPEVPEVIIHRKEGEA